RILVALYSSSPEHSAATQLLVPANGLILALLTALLIWFGVYPAPLMDLIQKNVMLTVAGIGTPESDISLAIKWPR
ncbi:MAG: hypothetical protein ABI618_17165, partial [Nitrospirota bacterium]